MLMRALKHIQNGFYIDVGAHDPSAGSVTKAFYDVGWHGINIEPITGPFQLLKSARPRDINLQVCVGPEDGTLELYDVLPSGLATALPEVAELHRASGFSVNTITTPVRRLDGLCKEFSAGEIHFLKIDVEGYEKQVLLGMDFSVFRPWIVVIEATIPNSPVENYDEWEYLVVRSGYQFVYFDGLNRFYVSNEHMELEHSFRIPPNFFDGFALAPNCYFSREVLSLAQQAESKAQQAESKAQQAESKAQQAESKAQQAESKAQQAESKAQQAENKSLEVLTQAENALAEKCQYQAQLSAVYSSTSWRMTKPLRRSFDHLRSLIQLRSHESLKQRAKALARRSIKLVSRYPRLKVVAIASVSRLGFANKLYRLHLAQDAPIEFKLTYSEPPRDLKHLSPRARKIYFDLKAAIQSHVEGIG